ncbi:MarR family transcriptional regulator [Halorussus marinus]|uniref:MarR family transcriptional regulator n=1 Tax=Halorussus marinus TaxID=2505976 RepID=UPI001B2FE974|nr:helix-turn-helix domain-containing protein [Halorussus marinus]
MPVPVDELTSDDRFPIKPDTNEYRVLSFLVAHREYGYTPREIAARTALNKTAVSSTMARLFEYGLIERADNVYYVDPSRASKLKRRLESLDSLVQFFESAPDDSYAEKGWEQELPTFDPESVSYNGSRQLLSIGHILNKIDS